MDWFWFALASAVFVSVETIFEKKILKQEHALRFSAVLAISMFFISLIFLPYLDFDNLSLSILFLIYLTSWISTIAFLLVTKAIRHMEVTNVSPLLSFGPVFVLIFSLFFLKENVTKLQIGGIILVIFGAYILQSKKNNFMAPIKEIIRSKYIHYIFIALMLNGFGSTLDRYFLKNNYVDSISYLFLLTTFLAINYSILIAVLYRGFKDINKGFKINGLMILGIAILLILSRFALLEAFTMAPAFLVEPVKRLSVLLVVIFGGTLLHEKHIFKKLIASVIMLMGVYLITL